MMTNTPRFAALLLALCLGTTSVLAAQPGVWIDPQLERQAPQIWPGMTSAQIAESVADMPDRIGSRTLNRLQKAVLLAPIEGEGTDNDLTAVRLKKLLSMGALADAKRLAETVDGEDILPAAIMDEALLAFVASGTRQAACLDLLAYKSEAPEEFKALSDESRSMIAACTASPSADAKEIDGMPTLSRAMKGKITYTMADLAGMNNAEAAFLAHEHNATLIGDLKGVEEYNTFRDLEPFKQALIMASPHASSKLQWHMLPYAIRHDIVTPALTTRILRGAPIRGTNIPAENAIVTAKGQPGWARLPYYYKAIKSYTKDKSPPVSALMGDILASGASYDLYGLLPFAPYIANLDLSELSGRNAYVAALVLGLSGQNPSGGAGHLGADESPWILSVLTRDQGLNEADFTTWADANLEKLAAIDTDLQPRVFLLLQQIIGGDDELPPYILHYDNKKNLTHNTNYVMHEEQAMSRAQGFAQDKALGPFIESLGHAGKNINPDRIDPAGMERMIRLLNDQGLVQSAKELAMESLTFKVSASLANGE